LVLQPYVNHLESGLFKLLVIHSQNLNTSHDGHVVRLSHQPLDDGLRYVPGVVEVLVRFEHVQEEVEFDRDKVNRTVGDQLGLGDENFC